MLSSFSYAQENTNTKQSTNEIELFNSYSGIYSSESVELKIKIYKENNALYGQATYQTPFLLIKINDNIYQSEDKVIILEFHPKENKFYLKQSGVKLLFTKQP